MLKELLKLTQEELRGRIASFNSANYTKVSNKGGIIFIPKGVEYYPLLCCHLDTINTTKNIKLTDVDIVDNGFKLSLNPASSAKCLGGDDRCGVYIALSLIKQGLPYAFGFFIDEEVGCIGSSQAFSLIDPLSITCFIGLDRKGFNEMALYGYDNQELINIFKAFGYEIEMGSITDASNLARLSSYSLSCINLSIGYYNEHTKKEFIIPDVSERLIKILAYKDTQQLLSRSIYYTEGDLFGATYKGYYGGYFDEYDAYNEALYMRDYYKDNVENYDGYYDEYDDLLEEYDNSFDYDPNNADILKARMAEILNQK